MVEGLLVNKSRSCQVFRRCGCGRYQCCTEMEEGWKKNWRDGVGKACLLCSSSALVRTWLWSGRSISQPSNACFENGKDGQHGWKDAARNRLLVIRLLSLFMCRLWYLFQLVGQAKARVPCHVGTQQVLMCTYLTPSHSLPLRLSKTCSLLVTGRLVQYSRVLYCIYT